MFVGQRDYASSSFVASSTYCVSWRPQDIRQRTANTTVHFPLMPRFQEEEDDDDDYGELKKKRKKKWKRDSLFGVNSLRAAYYGLMFL